MKERCYSLEFDGQILSRGFWLYVWRIKSSSREVLYVGRTGDSSSNFASSPFVRIGRHLDLRENAKSNSLVRRLKDEKIDPVDCNFKFVAFGPLFPEQKNKEEAHIRFRDRTSALEGMLASELRSRGYDVIGSHSTHKEPTKADAAKLEKFIASEFPKRRNLSSWFGF